MAGVQTATRARLSTFATAEDVLAGLADRGLLVEDVITLVVQHNGKKRGEIEVPADVTEEAAGDLALALENVQKSLGGRDPKKVIVVPGRLVNIVG